MQERGILARIRRSESASGLAIISPSAIYVIVMLAAPLAMVLIYSLMKDAGGGKIDWTLNLQNYWTVWVEKPQYRALMQRSLTVSMLVTLATVVLAYPVAYFVSFSVAPSKKSLWLFLITIPFWTSYVIRVFLWKVILGYNGVINSALMGLGIINEPITALNYNVGAIITTLAHAYAPFAILPIFVALEKIDRSLLEAGRDLGENAFSTFLRVTLPLAVPGVVSATLIVFIPTIGDYVTPILVGGPEGRLIANMIHLQYMKLDNYPLGSAMAVSAMLLVGAVSLLFLFLNRRWLQVRK